MSFLWQIHKGSWEWLGLSPAHLGGPKSTARWKDAPGLAETISQQSGEFRQPSCEYQQQLCLCLLSWVQNIKQNGSYLLSLLAMIKCSICSYQCDNWYVSNWRLACRIYFFWGEISLSLLRSSRALHRRGTQPVAVHPSGGITSRHTQSEWRTRVCLRVLCLCAAGFLLAQSCSKGRALAGNDAFWFYLPLVFPPSSLSNKMKKTNRDPWSVVVLLRVFQCISTSLLVFRHASLWYTFSNYVAVSLSRHTLSLSLSLSLFLPLYPSAFSLCLFILIVQCHCRMVMVVACEECIVGYHSVHFSPHQSFAFY